MTGGATGGVPGTGATGDDGAANIPVGTDTDGDGVGCDEEDAGTMIACDAVRGVEMETVHGPGCV
jgi:hypothetical protein